MTKVVEYTYHDANVNSSAISELWYSSTTRELFVKFKGTGQIAGYSDVSPVAADKLVGAHSVGSYYARYIKPNYTGINTKDVIFRAAPGLAKKNTEAKTPWGTPKKPYAAPGVYTPAQVPVKKQRFRVTGTILQPVNHNEVFEAETMEEAIAAFRKKYTDKDGQVTGVVKY